MDGKIAKLVAERDLTHTWIHVDMDAFFASVEELHDPRLVSQQGTTSTGYSRLHNSRALLLPFVLPCLSGIRY